MWVLTGRRWAVARPVLQPPSWGWVMGGDGMEPIIGAL